MLISGHKSDVGLVRQNNEDALYINDRLGVYVLADGMGGHEGGEIASNIAVNTVAKILSSSVIELQKKNVGQIVYNALHEANEEIILFRKNQINLMSMATTVVISIFLDDVVNCIHLGDSRAYLYKKDNNLIQLTTDDSLVTEMVKQGMSKDDLQYHSLRNIVTRYLGTVNLTIPEIQQFRVETNDSIILCSDGLTNMLNDKEIQSILRGNISMGPQDVCNLLVDSANAKGGQDNISVIVVQSK
ncbi:MAG TPA: protein phosphatase 2C domain-containing protein [Nitrososphaeraceae archaeon]|nr:protein phosphatase 2C domain-containing protein [Nitrososphaeraceae archaeon]